MSLLSVLNNARSSLSAVSQQSAIVSRNVANAEDPTATRKIGNQVYSRAVAVQVVSVTQSADPALFRALIGAQATLGTGQTVADALDRVRDILGDVDADTSPAARLANLRNALTELAATPESLQLQKSAIDAARDMATGLNQATTAVQSMRADADEELSHAATRLSTLLADLETVNRQVVGGTRGGADITDLSDRRDRLVSEISEYVGVSVRMRADNDMVLTTDSGIVLFETEARSVTFTPTQAFDPSVRTDSPIAAKRPGEFKIDGVSIFGSGSMAVKEGKLVGLLQLRDEIGTTFQDQLDALGDTLVKTFEENGSDGLFRRTGTATIAIAPNVDYTNGGNPALLRDGGIAGTVFNTTGDAGYSDRLNELVGRFAQLNTYPGGESATLADYAAASVAWFEGRRSDATSTADYQTVMVKRAEETLANKTGINLDEEMTRLLDLERSYQASTKLISTVGQMLDQLLSIA